MELAFLFYFLFLFLYGKLHEERFWFWTSCERWLSLGNGFYRYKREESLLITFSYIVTLQDCCGSWSYSCLLWSEWCTSQSSDVIKLKWVLFLLTPKRNRKLEQGTFHSLNPSYHPILYVHLTTCFRILHKETSTVPSSQLWNSIQKHGLLYPLSPNCSKHPLPNYVSNWIWQVRWGKSLKS